jgi:hypothetical protein
MNRIEILMAEVQRLRALLHEQNTAIGQTLAAAMGCYPHAPDENGNEDPSAPFVVGPAIAEDVAFRAAEMIREMRLTLAAEQGRQEGAPSDRWFPHHDRHGFQWLRGDADAPEMADIGVHLSGGEWRWTEPGHESRPYPSALAAMQAADKARSTS